MDINELNKTSVTTLFSKLTSQLQFGSNAFAGLLARVGVDGLLSKTTTSDVQTKPVENNIVKAKVVDSSANEVKKTSSVDKGKDVRKTDNKKTVSIEDNRKVAGKEDLAPAENGTAIPENEEIAVQENAVVIPMAAPVENISIPMAEAEGVESFEMMSVADGAMADGAGLKGFDTAGWEAEVLPAGVVDNLSAAKEEGTLPGAGDAEPLVTVSADDFSDKVEALVEEGVGGFGKDVTENDSDIFQVEVDDKDSFVPMSASAPKTEKAFVPSANIQSDEADVAVVPMKKTAVAENLPAVEENKDSRKDDSFVEQKNQNVPLKQTATVRQNDGEQEKVSADKELEAQAAELSEMLDGKALQVKVDVKEEKIAYHNNRDLIKNRAALDEIAAALDSAEGEGQGQVLSELVSPAQNTTMINVPVQPVVTTPVVGNVEESVTPNMPEVSSVSLNNNGVVHAAAGGVEYANTAKAEANAKSNEASFRDVFKGMSKEAVEQVKVNITKSAVKGIDSINVHLKPEELGRIEVKMQIKDGKLQAQIISSRPETMEALQREAQVLEKAFNDAGFQTDENSLSFSCRHDGQQADQNQSRENPLRSFIGEVFETEANGEFLSAEAANQNWSAEKGLNIKV